MKKPQAHFCAWGFFWNLAQLAQGKLNFSLLTQKFLRQERMAKMPLCSCEAANSLTHFPQVREIGLAEGHLHLYRRCKSLFDMFGDKATEQVLGQGGGGPNRLSHFPTLRAEYALGKMGVSAEQSGEDEIDFGIHVHGGLLSLRV